jgi:uncharacterized MAPEG superfamily protein
MRWIYQPTRSVQVAKRREWNERVNQEPRSSTDEMNGRSENMAQQISAHFHMFCQSHSILICLVQVKYLFIENKCTI